MFPEQCDRTGSTRTGFPRVQPGRAGGLKLGHVHGHTCTSVVWTYIDKDSHTSRRVLGRGEFKFRKILMSTSLHILGRVQYNIHFSVDTYCVQQHKPIRVGVLFDLIH